MPDLPLGEVHIWSARKPSTLLPGLEAALSPGEHERARRFRSPKDRLAYTFAHAFLRDVLSRYLHCHRGDIRFHETPFGKPFLAEPYGSSSVLEFNLSHTGGLALIGVCRGRRIGIDVEEIRPIDGLLSMAETYFTPDERAFIINQLPSDKGRALLNCWTRKEAYIKAIGNGLSIPLSSFDTLISCRTPVVLLESPPNSRDEAIWQVANLNVHEDYAAAVAVEKDMTVLVRFDWSNSIAERTKES